MQPGGAQSGEPGAAGPAGPAAEPGGDLTGPGGVLPEAGVPGSSEGLCWSYELDLAGLLAAIGGVQVGDPSDQEASLAEELEAAEAGPGTVRDLTGVIADQLPAGPGLAGWLANASPQELADWDLPGVVAAYRRVASWAQAGELAAVAQIASRAAARDGTAGVDEEGRPDRVTPSAASEVSLALAMSQIGASWWADLAVELGWRLRQTGAALAAGAIDLSRARLVAEATGPLSDEDARAVEDLVLPAAGGQTTGQLRAALRRAVLRVDPDGAEDRRQGAERQAKVGLYPDQVGTAALAGSSLPGVHAAAAMARISALARGMKAAGAGGGIDLLRAQVFLGLLLGTLPLIPAAPGSPAAPPDPDDPPGDPRPSPGDPSPGPGDGGGVGSPGYSDGPGDSDGPRGGPGAGGGHGPGGPDDRPGSGGPAEGRDGHRRPPGLTGDDPPPRDGPRGGSSRPRRCAAGKPAPPGNPEPPGPVDQTPDSTSNPPQPPPGAGRPDSGGPGSRSPGTCGHGPGGLGSGGSGSGPGPGDPGSSGSGPSDSDPPGDDGPPGPDSGDSGGCLAGEPDEALPLTDADAPFDDDGVYPTLDPAGGWGDLDDYDGSSAGAWPPLPETIAEIPPVLGGPPRTCPGLSPPDNAAGESTRPPPGLLDLTISWHVLTGQPAAPARLGRLGPVSTAQSLPLAALAVADPAAQWRVILTDRDGRAIAVERVRRGRLADNPGRPIGVTGRVTVIVPATALTRPAGTGQAGETGSGIRAAVLRAAHRAAARAEKARVADAAAGGCAHTTATAAYRPPTRIREYVVARDQTCRQPYCGQPAWRADLDHTMPWHKGGLTCPCNIGGGCRTHHKIKQQPGWTLRQPTPGHFEWTTPAGRTYTTTPDTYPT